MAPSGHAELRCRSAFSFLEGASNPEDLVDRAAELGIETLALADLHGLSGAPRFFTAARRAGIRPLVGAEVTLAEVPAAPGRGGTPPRSRPAPRGPSEPEAAGGWRLLLLAETREGYRNLCRILTLGQARRGKGEFLLLPEELEARAGGLTALVRADGALRPERLVWLRRVFGEHLAVDVSRTLDRSAEAAARRAVDLAEALRIPVAATGDVRHARPSGRRVLDAFHALRAGVTLDAAGRRLLPNGEHHLRAPGEMRRLFADRPAWLRETARIAERACFTLEDLDYRFPRFPVPGGESPLSHLRRLAFEGARRRYGTPLPGRVRRQLEHELAVIGRLDLAGYFLIVDDIARFAREQGMLCQGRGSAANSAVCYALGITAVDPVGMDLLFERFLSEERGEWPDIDLDLPSGEPRERVIQYVFQRYGERGAAMTATVITYRTRSAVREMGKVLGLESDAVDRLATLLGSLEWEGSADPAELRRLLRSSGVDPDAPRVAELLALVQEVRGLPRHLGQHTGGIVVAGQPLDHVVPIEPARMPGRRVIQWDKDDCADLGLIKIDLLGLGMLNALEEARRLLREARGLDLDLARIPPDDPRTFETIRRADTVGVFQIESRAQMATLPRMRPERFYDLVVEVAIIRPGPIVGRMVHPYLERRAGREPVRYPHPSLRPILERTLGVPIFQEQLLRIAMTAAGFSGGEAEELRRAMGFKRSNARMARLESRLREGMEARDIPPEAQEEILRGILSFARYGFPESHAASFALIAYASAYLKAHHPEAFLAGLLNAWPMGFYSPATLVKDAQRHGVIVRPVHVNASGYRTRLEPVSEAEPFSPRTRLAVRLGLRHVRGLREEAARALEAQRRQGGPFLSTGDLLRRVSLRRNELETLAEIGALPGGGDARRAALWQVAALERDRSSLFAGAGAGGAELPVPELTPLERTLADYRGTGLTTGPQVMAHLRPTLRRRSVLEARALRRARDGTRARVAGHVIVRQRPGSAGGLCFLTLEDETGTANAILTPRTFRRFRAPLHASPLLELEGRIQSRDGVVHLLVHRLRPLFLPDPSVGPTGARATPCEGAAGRPVPGAPTGPPPAAHPGAEVLPPDRNYR